MIGFIIHIVQSKLDRGYGDERYIRVGKDYWPIRGVEEMLLAILIDCHIL